MTRLQQRNCYNLADWEPASGARVGALVQNKRKNTNMQNCQILYCFQIHPPCRMYSMNDHKSIWKHALINLWCQKAIWRAIFSLLTQSCCPFVRSKSWNQEKKDWGFRIRAWIQDPKSRIKMRKLKRDGALVIFFLLSFALNKGCLRMKCWNQICQAL